MNKQQIRRIVAKAIVKAMKNDDTSVGADTRQINRAYEWGIGLMDELVGSFRNEVIPPEIGIVRTAESEYDAAYKKYKKALDDFSDALNNMNDTAKELLDQYS